MDHIVDPSLTLLNAEISPFRFRHQMRFGDQLGYVLGQHDMPVTETWDVSEDCVRASSLSDIDLHTKRSRERKSAKGGKCAMIWHSGIWQEDYQEFEAILGFIESVKISN